MRQEGIPLRVKRCIDVFSSACLIALTSPLMGAVAAGVALTMGPPVLFRQPRVGKDGRIFVLQKFRTMAVVANPSPSSDELRLTPFGRWLRKTSLDELPQLFNVLRGDMSLVGPRPLLVEYLAYYTAEQARRHEVLPGITGYAQVNGRNSLAHEDKFRLDVWYVDHWTLQLDFTILLRTLGCVLASRDVSAEGHSTMPLFTGSATAAPAAEKS